MEKDENKIGSAFGSFSGQNNGNDNNCKSQDEQNYDSNNFMNYSNPPNKKKPNKILFLLGYIIILFAAFIFLTAIENRLIGIGVITLFAVVPILSRKLLLRFGILKSFIVWGAIIIAVLVQIILLTDTNSSSMTSIGFGKYRSAFASMTDSKGNKIKLVKIKTGKGLSENQEILEPADKFTQNDKKICISILAEIVPDNSQIYVEFKHLKSGSNARTESLTVSSSMRVGFELDVSNTTLPVGDYNIIIYINNEMVGMVEFTVK